MILKTDWSVVDTENVIKQLEQVKFTCKMESFQKDANGSVRIDENDLIDDPTFNLELMDQVE